MVSDSCSVMLTRKGVSEIEMYDTAKLYEMYALTPAQMIDLKGLMGDNSDQIPVCRRWRKDRAEAAASLS